MEKEVTRTIHFRCGKSKEVPVIVAHKIVENLSKGAADFQYFTDGDKRLVLVVNLKNICYID